jgi:hypothetical protein
LRHAIDERAGIFENAADMRAGLVAAMIVNSNPYRKRGARTVQPRDFFRPAPKKAQTVEDMAAVLKAFAAQQNRQIARA